MLKNVTLYRKKKFRIHINLHDKQKMNVPQNPHLKNIRNYSSTPRNYTNNTFFNASAANVAPCPSTSVKISKSFVYFG